MERHKLDLLSLIGGLLFVVLGIGQLLGLSIAEVSLNLSWMWPLLLIIGGLALLRGILRRPESDA